MMDKPSEITFESKGRTIRLDSFLPPTAKRAPVLLLLHGASGLGGGNHYIPHLASGLAEQGLGTMVLRYFDSTGTVYANDAAIWKNFETWLGTIKAAVDQVAAMPQADAEKIA